MFRKSIEYLKRDKLIIYPTETVYGIGANALSTKAIKKVFDQKERSYDEPISLAISDFKMLEEVAEVDCIEKNVIKKNLPGPITFLVKKKENVPDILTSGKEKVGIRFPDNWVAKKLIEEFGSPITSTSANVSGEDAPANFSEINLDIEHRLFGGKSRYTKPSTVYDLIDKKLIRRGPVPLSEIKKSYWG